MSQAATAGRPLPAVADCPVASSRAQAADGPADLPFVSRAARTMEPATLSEGVAVHADPVLGW